MKKRHWILIIVLGVIIDLLIGVLQIIFPVFRLVWTAFLDLNYADVVVAGLLIFALILIIRVKLLKQPREDE